MPKMDTNMGHKRRKEDSPIDMKYAVHYLDSPKTSLLFAAQSKSYDCKARTDVKKVVNPFVPKVHTLEQDTCSPTLFIIGKSSQKKEFWSIDQISKIQPAVIDSPEYITMEYDEKTESKAQEAIGKYFSETHSIVSPINSAVGTWNSPSETCNNYFGCAEKNSTPAVSSTPCTKTYDRRIAIKVDVGEQTDLSLPPKLPPEVEAILKPYFRSNYDNTETEEAVMNTSTLRRKLLFHKDDEHTRTEEFSCIVDSPLPDYSSKHLSRINWSHSNDNKKTDREDDFPSSPELSPINNTNNLTTISAGSSSYCSASLDQSIDTTFDSIQTGQQNEVDPMAISLENIEEHNLLFSSTKMVQKVKEDNWSNCQDTGYNTINESSIKQDYFFSSTRISSE